MPARLRIVVAVHGRGRGHATRARGFLPALERAGHQLEVWTGDAALPLLAAFSPAPITIVGPGPRLLPRIARRALEDRRRLESLAPDLLISDGDAPSTIAARSLGIPVIAVGHGLAFAFADLGPLPRLLRLREAANALSSSLLSDARIAVHFGPARPRHPSTRIARADVSPLLDRRRPVGDTIVAYFRDGGGDAWLRALLERGETVRLFASPSAPRAGLVAEPFDVRAFTDALSQAKGVVGTAGSNLVAECMHLGVPLLALPSAGDVEQRLNASMLVAAGRGVQGALERLDTHAIDAFLGVADRVRLQRRMPDGLPDAPGVADALLASIDALFAQSADAASTLATFRPPIASR